MSIIFSTDSYKISHPQQFPKGTTHTQYYIESRGGALDKITVAGVNKFITTLEKGVTLEDVERANKLFRAHFGSDIFHYEGWKKLAQRFAEGKGLPLKVYAVPEGTRVPVKSAVLLIENTEPEFYWLPGHCETASLRDIWYMSTVATHSSEFKKEARIALESTSDLTGDEFDMVLNTRLHDFGARGATSGESAGAGGLAHLYNFIGTDTVEALILAQDLYNAECAGISIPAREHSTTTSYGLNQEGLREAYLNSVDLFGKGMYAIVYDSQDFERDIADIETYKDKIIEQGGTLVARPDSGDMLSNIEYALQKFGEIFGYTVNSKGFKVLPSCIRLIQGDSIDTPSDIRAVYDYICFTCGWSAENIAFGAGGGLLQKVNRDTYKWAMKCCAIRVNGEWREVYKSPKGSEWKTSKKGYLLPMVHTVTSMHKDVNLLSDDHVKYILDLDWKMAAELYYDEGRVRSDTLPEIRSRAAV